MKNIESHMLKADKKPQHVEGRQYGKWVLLDFSDVVCHIFHEPVRRFYSLERLWGDAPQVKIPGYTPEDTDLMPAAMRNHA